MTFKSPRVNGIKVAKVNGHSVGAISHDVIPPMPTVHLSDKCQVTFATKKTMAETLNECYA